LLADKFSLASSHTEHTARQGRERERERMKERERERERERELGKEAAVKCTDRHTSAAAKKAGHCF
jgi:hypothetical protein